MIYFVERHGLNHQADSRVSTYPRLKRLYPIRHIPFDLMHPFPYSFSSTAPFSYLGFINCHRFRLFVLLVFVITSTICILSAIIFLQGFADYLLSKHPLCRPLSHDIPIHAGRSQKLHVRAQYTQFHDTIFLLFLFWALGASWFFLPQGVQFRSSVVIALLLYTIYETSTGRTVVVISQCIPTDVLKPILVSFRRNLLCHHPTFRSSSSDENDLHLSRLHTGTRWFWLFPNFLRAKIYL